MQFFIMAVAVTRIMFHRGTEETSPILREIISKTSNFKEAERAISPSRIGTIVFRMRFQRLVMLQTDVYVAADRYQAKWLDKRRIL